MDKNLHTTKPKTRCSDCDAVLTSDELDEFGTICYPCDTMPSFVNDFAHINEPYDEFT